MKKKEFYILHSEICKTLSHPKRQEILDHLRDQELTVSELVKKTKIPQANLSQHLAFMRTKGVVKTRRQGVNIYYSLTSPKIIQAFDLISDTMKEFIYKQKKTLDSAGKK